MRWAPIPAAPMETRFLLLGPAAELAGAGDKPAEAFLRDTLRRGYTEAIADPASAVSAMTRQVPGLHAKELATQLTAVSPAFTVGVPSFGTFNRPHLDEWSVWEAKVGITRKPPDVTLTFWLPGNGE